MGILYRNSVAASYQQLISIIFDILKFIELNSPFGKISKLRFGVGWGVLGMSLVKSFNSCCCSINGNIIVGKQAVIYVGWDQLPERVRPLQVKVGLKSDFWQRVPNKC